MTDHPTANANGDSDSILRQCLALAQPDITEAELREQMERCANDHPAYDSDATEQ